jgi:hypothetical protein
LDHQRHSHSQSSCCRGGGEAAAEQFLGEQENEERQAQLRALPKTTEDAKPLTDWIKRALTRKTTDKTVAEAEVPPSERLVLGVKFAIALTFSLTALEIAHLALLHSWNSEVFAAITGLAGTITGILISQKTGE